MGTPFSLFKVHIVEKVISNYDLLILPPEMCYEDDIDGYWRRLTIMRNNVKGEK